MDPPGRLGLSVAKAPLGILDYVGISMWGLGFLTESVADFQKRMFREEARNGDKWISSGLWKYSRHPNYFGEMVLWTGLALSAFGGTGRRLRASVVFLSPLFVAAILIFVSGIPKLEESGDKRFGENEAYRKYKENTPVLVPFIGRRGDASF